MDYIHYVIYQNRLIAPVNKFLLLLYMKYKNNIEKIKKYPAEFLFPFARPLLIVFSLIV